LLGTQGDNVQDAHDRRLIAVQQKITDAQVRELDARYRAGGVSMTTLAREYGVSVPTVSEIINRKKRRRAFAVD
jgi:DNA-binding MarR family transcriptional regulator